MATGFAAMEQAVKNINTPRGGGVGRRFDYFDLEDGKSVVVRFITDEDEIVTCNFYEFVRVYNRDGTTGSNSFISAPSYYEDDPTWTGEDWVVKYGGEAKDFKTQEWGPAKPKERTVAIAVVREEVPVESSGKPKFKYRDKIVPVTVKVRDKDGKETGEEKTYQGRQFLVVRKDAKTFWGNVVPYYGEFNTLVDRDYKIKRNGVQLATNFSCTPVGPDEDWDDVSELRKRLHARYGYGTGKDADGNELSKDSEDRFLYCAQTLKEWAADQASEDRAKTLLTKGNFKATAQERHETPAAAEKGSAWSSGEDEAQAAPPPAEGDVSALRARLESHT